MVSYSVGVGSIPATGSGGVMDKKVPRQYSLIAFDADGVDYQKATGGAYPFSEDGVYVFLGEIPNMPDHCVVCDHRTGQIYSGYHTWNFKEIPEGET
jgi:hypothetical protein